MEDIKMATLGFWIFPAFVILMVALVALLFLNLYLENRGFVASDFSNENVRRAALQLRETISEAVRSNKVFNRIGKKISSKITMETDCGASFMRGLRMAVFIKESRLIFGARDNFHPQHLIVEVKMNLRGSITVIFTRNFLTYSAKKYRLDEIEEAKRELSSYLRKYRFFTNVYGK
jgi:hypothetical protein